MAEYVLEKLTDSIFFFFLNQSKSQEGWGQGTKYVNSSN